MRDFIATLVVIAGSVMLAATAVRADVSSPSSSRFSFKDAQGKTHSARVISKYYPKQIVHPFAKIDPSIDPKLMRAATLADERAHAHSME